MPDVLYNIMLGIGLSLLFLFAMDVLLEHIEEGWFGKFLGVSGFFGALAAITTSCSYTGNDYLFYSFAFTALIYAVVINIIQSRNKPFFKKDI